jgi:hypothetical protein
MVKLQSLKVDPQRQTEGVWFDWSQGVRLKIARLGNPAFDARVREIIEEAKEKGEEPDTETATLEAIAKTILLGWEGIEGEDDEPWTYTPERSLELLSDDGMRDLYKFVLVKSSESAHYRFRADREALGN